MPFTGKHDFVENAATPASKKDQKDKSEDQKDKSEDKDTGRTRRSRKEGDA